MCGDANTIPFFLTLAKELQQSTQLWYCNSVIVSMADKQVLDHLSRRLCPALPLSCHSAQKADDCDQLDKPKCINGRAIRGPEKHVSSLRRRCRAVGKRDRHIKLKALSGYAVSINHK